jgi:hypothetical protein
MSSFSSSGVWLYGMGGMVLFWGALIGLVVLAARALGGHRETDQDQSREPFRRHYASGRLSRAERQRGRGALPHV